MARALEVISDVVALALLCNPIPPDHTSRPFVISEVSVGFSALQSSDLIIKSRNPLSYGSVGLQHPFPDHNLVHYSSNISIPPHVLFPRRILVSYGISEVKFTSPLPTRKPAVVVVVECLETANWRQSQRGLWLRRREYDFPSNSVDWENVLTVQPWRPFIGQVPH